MNVVAGESRLMDTEELRAYTNLGRNNAMKLGEEIGAKVKVGKRVLWDRAKIDKYLDELTGVDNMDRNVLGKFYLFYKILISLKLWKNLFCLSLHISSQLFITRENTL